MNVAIRKYNETTDTFTVDAYGDFAYSGFEFDISAENIQLSEFDNAETPFDIVGKSYFLVNYYDLKNQSEKA